MNNNLYSSVYRNLEREFIYLSNLIHINDEQIKIYSIKITELLIRTVVEVESIIKELYFLNEGTKTDDKDLFFDTDCFGHLESKWKLSKKLIFVSSPNLYFDKEENKIINPLYKANKRGSSSSDWLQAYQAVKHNRGKNLKKGNLKHLIRALGGLYILNIYYKDTTFNLENDGTATNFDTSLGSELFSVKLHNSRSISTKEILTKRKDFEECIYLIKATDKSREDIINAFNDINNSAQEKFNREIIKIPKFENGNIDEYHKTLKDTIIKLKKTSEKQATKENGLKLKQSLENNKYEAILNKHQF
ncbi:hypothetical protein ACFSSB_15680 [Lacinutrix gracilariae]|uniref:Uncharacterized protein n=1 Tax=Lacinutrix gracilariae TaxID=1747198 RepID=A0ABW5K4K4_9FLAO